jgi:polyphosphate kinase
MISKSLKEKSIQPEAIAPGEPGTFSEEQLGQVALNRELSWLEFNRRVLHEAQDERTPLLERVKFLGIFTSNLDEFFMKRVGGFKRQVAAGVAGLSIDGMTPSRQLAAIRQAVVPMLRDQAECFKRVILPALREYGVHLLSWDQLTGSEQRFARDYFARNVFPVVTPFAVDPGHPFPFLSNLSLSLGVVLTHRGQEDRLFARVKVPEVFPMWLRLETDPSADQWRFVSLLDVIGRNLDALFPGMSVLSVTPFRVTRNADVEAEEEDTADLLEMIEEELRQRRLAEIVRLEHGPNPDPWCIQFLMEELGLSETDVYELPGELDYTGLKPITELELPKLKYEPWTPVVPPPLAGEESDLFNVIRAGDLLVHHPYESFSASVERFISTAADDPKVLAIKVTLYRVGDSYSLINSLIRAAETNKQVVCLVELKARFDEQRNIYWAQKLEQVGIKVVYGVVGLKTHSKLALVVRQEADGLRCYTHIGTGNYNVQTSKLYTDLGLFTCKPSITGEVVELFHYLTGRSMKSDYKELLVAPMTMRGGFLEMIEQEMAHQVAGRPARIVVKINSLEDQRIMQALCRASQAGVPIDLIIRGFCCLRPGVKGLTENVRVMSVIGRFLEHSRIFYFRAGAQKEEDGRFFIGSADWMYRNLSNRVEVVAPIHDPLCRQKLWQVLNVLLNDRRHGWDLMPDGQYVQRQPQDPQHELGTHTTLMRLARRTTGPVMAGTSEEGLRPQPSGGVADLPQELAQPDAAGEAAHRR